MKKLIIGVMAVAMLAIPSIAIGGREALRGVDRH